MTLHNEEFSFTTPIIVGLAGILLSFMLIATFVILAQRKDLLEDYHDINRSFIHDLAANYTETLSWENGFIPGRAATLPACNDELSRAVNVDPEKRLTTLMQLQNVMPSVSFISLANTEGHYLRAPEVLKNGDSLAFAPKTWPQFIKQVEASTFGHYISPYMDFFAYHPTIIILKPIITPKGKLEGSPVFHLDLTSMGFVLRQIVAPVQREFFAVQRGDKVVLHSDPGALLELFVSDEPMDKMTSGGGQLHDVENDIQYYYYSFTSPGWSMIHRVDNATLVNSTRHEINLVIGGFSLAAITISLLGLYLRHASRIVLINIINATRTDDVKRASHLEAILNKVVETNKRHGLTYVRQATINTLTGCKNRHAFDSDTTALMNDHQPFAFALVGIDSFKSTNSTQGYLNDDIVLCNAARRGLQVSQPLEIPLYRHGGGELAVTLPTEHIDSTRMLLETWRVNVERRTWRKGGLTVTFSAGLGERNMRPLDKLVVSVDEALYKTKQRGRNRILRV